MEGTAKRRRALVVGLGIAGIATALRLRQVGWEPVVVERSAGRRSNGYFILLFGAGQASAGRLGVLEAIGDRTPHPTAYDVDRRGRRTPGMSLDNLPGKPRVVLRGDVERALFEALPDDVEIRYSTVPTRISQDDAGDSSVEVTLHDTVSDATVTERFDLVVGADGMRSTVRRLVFDPQDYLHPLNYMIATTVLGKPIEGIDQDQGLTLPEPGRSAWIFPFSNHPPGLLFSYRTADIDAEFARPPIESIRAAFGPQPPGPLLEKLLTAFEQAPDHLFDSVHQVRMPGWHRGRVVLVGDAAWCVTLYAGMGASSGMAGGELLGTMLQRHSNDLPGALQAWETRLRPWIHTEQTTALVMRRLFTPHDRKEKIMRTAMLRFMNAPVIGQGLGKIMNGARMKNKQFDVAAV